MYAIMVENKFGKKEVAVNSLVARTEENLTALNEVLKYMRQENTGFHYSIVKIDYEVVK